LTRRSPAAAVAVLLLNTGCGYFGGTLPPLANVPNPPADLAALQRGAKVIAHFTEPTITTESFPIKGDLDLDLRAGPPPDPWNESEWAAHAERITPTHITKLPIPRPGATAQQLAEYEFPSTPWTGKTIVIAARVVGSNQKASNWSALLTLPVVPPLSKPEQLTATPLPNGIRLAWRDAGGHFRVFRSVEGGPGYAEIATTTVPEYLDATAEFGKKYTYQVLAFAAIGPQKEAQSDLSGETVKLYKDEFPPATPTGLIATASPSSVELSWNSNAEPDLAGYRVYRSTSGGPFEKLADVNAIPPYSDHAVERGKAYRYAVTAMDKSGNESPRSPLVEAALQ
jgi:hypothetical protein